MRGALIVERFLSWKSLWGLKELSPYIPTVCPLQEPRQSHVRSRQTNHRPITPAGTSGLSSREADR